MSTITLSKVFETRNMKAMILWETLTCGDVGSIYEVPDWADSLTVQAHGTFTDDASPAETATLTIYGSNDGVNWAALQADYLGTVSFTTAGIKSVALLPRYIRPGLSLASGGDVDVWLFARKS